MPTLLPDRRLQPGSAAEPVAPPRLSQERPCGQAAESRADLLAVAGALVAGLLVALAVLWRSLV
jgi:hypothetical protein